MRLLVAIVAFHHGNSLPAVLAAVSPQLNSQDTLCIVDNAGDGATADACGALRTDARIALLQNAHNRGFTGGNNQALAHGEWQTHDAVLLLNPDLLLPAGWITRALSLLATLPKVGILSGPLVKYDFSESRPTPVLDSLGIRRGGLLRSWRDVGQGQPLSTLDTLPLHWNPPAACGALMLLPRAAVAAVMQDGGLFDDRFFTYKEDIDLSLRIRRAGYEIRLHKDLLAHHGRGWHARRRDVSYALRKLSARNDLYLHLKHRSPYLPLSVVKAAYVHLVERFLHRIGR